MPTPDSADFYVGETVVLSVTVSDPRTGAGLDPTSLTLVDLTRGGAAVSLPDGTAFHREATGRWVLLLETAGFAPGVYRWRALASGPDGVSVVDDTLVLRAGALG